MSLLFKCQFGSHLYGTNLPTSDLDYKGIYIPDGRDIILQKVKDTVIKNTNMANTKNTAEDEDFEIFSAQEYIKLLLEGQTIALDMLFCTDQYIQHESEFWKEVQSNKDRFLHKGTSAFVGYCKTQAAKYGLKGSRMAALKIAIEFLDRRSGTDRLEEHWDAITLLANATENMSIDNLEGPNQVMLEHWNVCNCKMGKTARVGYAITQFKGIYDKYGERAKLAEKNQGVDWKALMHAVRVCSEAKELLSTGNISFPRPDAPLLLQIRKQELTYPQVAEIIENGIEEIEQVKAKSNLPEAPDFKFAEELVYNTYAKQIAIDFVRRTS